MKSTPDLHDAMGGPPHGGITTCEASTESSLANPVTICQLTESVHPELRAIEQDLEGSKKKSESDDDGLLFHVTKSEEELATRRSSIESALFDVGNAIHQSKQAQNALREEFVLRKDVQAPPSPPHDIPVDDSMVLEEPALPDQTMCDTPSSISARLECFIDQDQLELAAAEDIDKQLKIVQAHDDDALVEATLGGLGLEQRKQSNDLGVQSMDEEDTVHTFDIVSDHAVLTTAWAFLDMENSTFDSRFRQPGTTTAVVRRASIPTPQFFDLVFVGLPPGALDADEWLRSSSPDTNARQAGSIWTGETIVRWATDVEPQNGDE